MVSHLFRAKWSVTRICLIHSPNLLVNLSIGSSRDFNYSIEICYASLFICVLFYRLNHLPDLIKSTNVQMSANIPSVVRTWSSDNGGKDVKFSVLPSLSAVNRRIQANSLTK
jgi:hypothetical protein